NLTRKPQHKGRGTKTSKADKDKNNKREDENKEIRATKDPTTKTSAEEGDDRTGTTNQSKKTK
ncbi:hypothetical protein ACQ1ZZ_15245, partial [Enterococcus faecalis]|uniref:hypothetical protein n=1 Tax=Enterococcus faecalis TaxID=1351 RepID=UPI003D6A7757